MAGEVTPLCLICGEEDPGGLKILGKGLCRGCEEKLLLLSAADTTYNYYIDRIKTLWLEG
jgi:hypothetical protein